MLKLCNILFLSYFIYLSNIKEYIIFLCGIDVVNTETAIHFAILFYHYVCVFLFFPPFRILSLVSNSEL